MVLGDPCDRVIGLFDTSHLPEIDTATLYSLCSRFLPWFPDLTSLSDRLLPISVSLNKIALSQIALPWQQKNRMISIPSPFMNLSTISQEKRLQRSELNSEGGLSNAWAQSRWGPLISHQQQADCSNFHMQNNSFKWPDVTASEIYWHRNLNLWSGGSNLYIWPHGLLLKILRKT